MSNTQRQNPLQCASGEHSSLETLLPRKNQARHIACLINNAMATILLLATTITLPWYY
jgi:hypothetical protein